MLTTSEVELFRRRLSRGLFAWNVNEVMKTVSEDPKVLSNCGRTLALQKACDMDRNSVSLELIRLLIEEGSRQNFGERGGLSLPRNDYGSAPLQMLVKRGSLRVLKHLSESQPPLLCKEDVCAYELLHFATSHGHLDVVQFLLALDPDSVYSRDHQGALPIHMTSYATTEFSHDQSIRELLVNYHLKRYNETLDQKELFEWIYPDSGHFTKEEVLIYLQDIASMINNINVSLPILSSAISAGASHTCLLQIMHLFRNSTSIKDSKNRLPIHHATEKGISWHHSLKDIFHANPCLISEPDPQTGLSPVILSACCDCENESSSNLDSIFELMRKHPESISYHLY